MNIDFKKWKRKISLLRLSTYFLGGLKIGNIHGYALYRESENLFKNIKYNTAVAFLGNGKT